MKCAIQVGIPGRVSYYMGEGQKGDIGKEVLGLLILWPSE